ncbi:MAG TPA: DCC1-like thiol-disulfide oxidoreductase family protein [Bacteroidia bacterium]|nr:DCC1-like thiol-disulfide oxidoreductase family protein [Bacteroidia bacterium]HNT80537.1 DCC1-like thiol-disulfide oxidoreductase family protein [Bacteroidia bacterium]
MHDIKNLHLILYDGQCKLCNFWVRFVLKRDKKEKFHFCHRQSEMGKKIISHMPDKIKQHDSVLFMDQGRLFAQSDAIIMILRRLGGIYNLLFLFIIIPHFIRNFVYRLVARYRYKWFGKTDQCVLPDPKWNARFLS